jgi:hypothetical protein
MGDRESSITALYHSFSAMRTMFSQSLTEPLAIAVEGPPADLSPILLPGSER